MSGLTDLPSSVGKLEQLVDFLVDAWQSRNWVRRLLVLDVLLLGLNPPFVEGGMKLLGLSAQLPNGYMPIWLGAVVAAFLLGLGVAARGRSRAAPAPVDIAERAAIKGLVAFELRDAEIFARLQREQELRDCLVAVAGRDFRFGYLNGDSGSGKTSFLQAGLWPRLMEQGFRCGYVKFSDQDPERTVRLVLADLAPAADVSGAPGLAACLAAAAASEDSPLVLLFDQFEQVFVQRTRAEREPFVRELAQWYQGGGPNSAKILLCLRSDFVGHLVELQKAMGYSLGPQQVFRLEKLDPARAAAVLSALGDMAGMAVDEAFVEELARQELADPKDGLVSPVDLQVLAWMIAGQRTAEERAFQRDALRKMGGVEGLLERFLKRSLAVRETEARRQAAIKVLLLLTDLDQSVRAGLLTAEQLAQKKDGSLSIEDLREALDWLARSDIRLVARAQRDGETAYELAHERLIPALRRLANRELTDVDRANDLLNRRVNEWLGNSRAARYLLTWRELRIIEQMWPYLHWGLQETQKRELFARSRQRRNRWLTGAAAGMAIACAVLLWLRSPWGEIWQMKRDLAGLTKEIAPDTLPGAAAGFAVARDDAHAHKALEQIPEKDRMEAYLNLARLSAAVGRPAAALDFLERGRYLAEKLEAPHDSYDELAHAALDAYEATKDRALWTKALAAASETKKDAAYTWVRFAKVGALHADLPDALQFLQQARKSLNGVEDAENQQLVIITAADLAKTTKSAGFLDPGIQVLADSMLFLLQAWNEPVIQLAQATRELGTPEQKNELRRILDEQYKMIGPLEEASQRIERLTGLATFAMALGEPARALTYVTEARPLLVDVSVYVAPRYFRSLDLVTAQLENKAETLVDLRREIDQAESVDADRQTAALSAVAERAANLGETDESLRLLSQSVASLDKIDPEEPEEPEESEDDYPISASSVWEDLGSLAVRLAEQTRRAEFLDLAVQAGQASPHRKEPFLEQVVQAAIKMAEESRNLKALSPGVAAAGALDHVPFFLALAKAAADLGDPDLAGNLLDRASRAVGSFSDLENGAKAYADLAETASIIHQLDRSTNALDKGAEMADQIELESNAQFEHHLRALTFARLAQAAVAVGDRPRAGDFLDRAGQAMQEVAKEKQHEPQDVTDWWTLANAATEAGDRKRAAKFLDYGFEAAAAQRPNDPSSWLAQAVAAARAGEWGLARRSAARIQFAEYRAVALSCILVERAAQDSPNVLATFAEQFKEIQSECEPED